MHCQLLYTMQSTFIHISAQLRTSCGQALVLPTVLASHRQNAGQSYFACRLRECLHTCTVCNTAATVIASISMCCGRFCICDDAMPASLAGPVTCATKDIIQFEGIHHQRMYPLVAKHYCTPAHIQWNCMSRHMYQPADID